MPLRTKALVSAGLVAALTVVLGAVLFVAVLDIREGDRRLRQVQAMRERLLAAEALVGDYVAGPSDRILRQWRILHERIVDDVAELGESLGLPAGRRAELEARLASMSSAFEVLAGDGAAGEPGRALQRARLRADGQAVAARLGEIEAELDYRESRTLTLVVAGLSGVIVVLMGVAVGHYVAMRHIVGRALDEVGGAVAGIAAGHLDEPIRATRRDEIGGLLRALETMRALLAANRRELESEREKAEALGHAKTQFLATMSHEIRTPLNGVLGAVHLLRGSDDGAAQQRYLAMAEGAGRTLLSVINDVLDFSKIESGGLELDDLSFRPDVLVDEVVAMFAEAARDKGILLAHESACDGTVRGDPLRLRQILINLVSNAVKFTERGKVGVRLSGASLDDGRRRVALEVSDTGIGIPREARDLIFDPFRQSDGSMTRRFGGTGLGLAISRRLAEAMGGEISVESAPDVGSRFTLTLVLPAGDDAGSTAAERAVHDGPLGLTVLVAEDIEINRAIVGEILNAFGCSVRFAATGREAIALAAAERFDAVLMDIHMPDLDGLEATRQIRAGDGPCAAAPIIGLTADAFHEQHARFLAAGMSDVLTKPVEPLRLRRRLAEIAPAEAQAPSAARDRAAR